MCRATEVTRGLVELAGKSPLVALSVLMLAAAGTGVWYLGEKLTSCNDKMIELYAQQTATQVEVARTLQLLTVRMEELEKEVKRSTP